MARFIKYFEGNEWKFATVKDVGDLEKLKTTEKSDVVSAINELFTSGGGSGGGTIPAGLEERLSALEGKFIVAGVVVDLGDVTTVQDQIKAEQDRLNGEIEQAKADILAKADSSAVTTELDKKIDSTKYTNDYNLVKGDLAKKVAQLDFDNLSGRVTTATDKITAIEGEVSSKVGKFEFDDAFGVNRWVASLYPIAGIDFEAIAPAIETIQGKIPTSVKDYDDALSLTAYPDNNAITSYFTKVKMKLAKSVVLNIKYKSSLAVYLNGAMVYQNKANAQIVVPITISLRAGWNTIEILNGNGIGAPVLTLDKTLSSQVDLMTHTVGVGDKNETRMSLAETSIKQNKDEINLKATKLQVTDIGNKVTEQTSQIQLLNDKIVSTVSKTDFDAYAGKVNAQETQLTQLSGEISAKVSKVEYDTLNKKVTDNTAAITATSSSLTSKISQTQLDTAISGAKGEIQTSTESMIKQSSDSILLQTVNKNGVINSINASTEGIKLSGSKITITGLTTIDNAVIKSAHITDLAVTGAKIADLAVGNAKIADLAVTGAKIDNLAVTSAKIANAAITNAKINDLDAGKINAGFINTARIAANTITSDQIAANAITTEKIAAGSITADKLTISSPNLLSDFDSFELMGADTTIKGTNTFPSSKIVGNVGYYGVKSLMTTGAGRQYLTLSYGKSTYIPLTNGKRYVFSAYVKTDATTNASVSIELSVSSGKGGTEVYSVRGAVHSVKAADGWKRISDYLDIAVSDPYAILSAYASTTAGAKIYWDAMQIEEVSASTTVPSKFNAGGSTFIDGSTITAGEINGITIVGSTIIGGTISSSGYKDNGVGNAASELTVNMQEGAVTCKSVIPASSYGPEFVQDTVLDGHGLDVFSEDAGIRSRTTITDRDIAIRASNGATMLRSLYINVDEVNSGIIGQKTHILLNHSSPQANIKSSGVNTYLGAKNSSWSHFDTDSTNGFYSYRPLTVVGDVNLTGKVASATGDARFEGTSTTGYTALGSQYGIVYLQTAKEVRVTKWLSGQSYMPIFSAGHTTVSSEKYKTNIEKYLAPALPLINKTTVYQYNLKSEYEDGIEKEKYGLILERETPEEFKNDDGVETYSMVSIAFKAIQELSAEVEMLKAKLNKR